MQAPYSRTTRLALASTSFSPAASFLLAAASTWNWASGRRSLPYQTVLMPGYFLGHKSVASCQAFHWASVASAMGVNAKQCIRPFSAAVARPEVSNRVKAAVKRVFMGVTVLEILPALTPAYQSSGATFLVFPSSAFTLGNQRARSFFTLSYWGSLARFFHSSGSLSRSYSSSVASL